ncbi:hypothetical protein ACIA49_15475 [Kribbella sp. NPDC051587]|uniref:hypothetical protein n=1 Tax=Kribbella sp. NPDC051587 TaxID=3364119 RepID=UPI00379CB629
MSEHDSRDESRPRRQEPPIRKTHPVRSTFVVLCALALLVGCGGKADQNAATTTVTSTPSPTPSMSVRQAASKVAGLRAKNQKLVKDFEDLCDLTKWSDSLVDAQALACSLVVQRAPLEGQIAAKALTMAHPPAEVAELLVATRASASALGKVSSEECEKSAKSDGCLIVERFKASEAADAFQLAFADWEPYL